MRKNVLVGRTGVRDLVVLWSPQQFSKAVLVLRKEGTREGYRYQLESGENPHLYDRLGVNVPDTPAELANN